MDFFSDHPGDPGGQNSGNASGAGSVLGCLLFGGIVCLVS
jgi:hypothetical protein